MRVDDVTYPLVDDLAALTYLVNLNSIELHVPQWTVDGEGTPQHPNRLVIDLDPGTGGRPAGVRRSWPSSCATGSAPSGSTSTRSPAAARGCSSTPRSAGDLSSDQVRDLAQQLAQELTKKHPDLIAVEDDEVAAARQGLPRLEPERRRQDDRRALLPARPGDADLSPRRAPGTRSRPARRTLRRCEQLMFDEVLERIDRDGDLLEGLLSD